MGLVASGRGLFPLPGQCFGGALAAVSCWLNFFCSQADPHALICILFLWFCLTSVSYSVLFCKLGLGVREEHPVFKQLCVLCIDFIVLITLCQIPWISVFLRATSLKLQWGRQKHVWVQYLHFFSLQVIPTCIRDSNTCNLLFLEVLRGAGPSHNQMPFAGASLVAGSHPSLLSLSVSTL